MLASKPGVPVRLSQSVLPVFRILGHNPGPMTGPGTNSYLIRGEKNCLIDPGPADERQLQAILLALGDEQLDYILVTHTHRDHSPGALRLQEETGAETVGLKAPDAQGQDQSFEPQAEWWHDDVIDCGDYSLQLIHTPGHVSNHLCYLLRESRMLFTGDHVLQGTTPVILPPDGDMSDYLDSVRHLQTLDLVSLAPGHGEVMEEPELELSKLLAHRQRREDKIVAVMKQLGPEDLDVILPAVYDDVPAALLPIASRTLLAHLIKLEREGRVQSSEKVWRLVA